MNKICKVCGRGTKKLERVICKHCGASEGKWIVTAEKKKEPCRKKMLDTNDTITLSLRRDDCGRLGVQFDEKLFVKEVSEWAKQFGIEKGQKVLACMGRPVKTKKDLIKAHDSHLIRGDPNVFILTLRRVTKKRDLLQMTLVRDASGVFGIKTDDKLFITGCSDHASQFGCHIGQKIVACENVPVNTKQEFVAVKRMSPRYMADRSKLRITVVDAFDEWVDETPSSLPPPVSMMSTTMAETPPTATALPIGHQIDTETAVAMSSPYPAVIPGTSHLDETPASGSHVAPSTRIQRIRRTSGLTNSTRDLFEGLAHIVDNAEKHRGTPSSRTQYNASYTSSAAPPVAQVLSVTAIERVSHSSAPVTWTAPAPVTDGPSSGVLGEATPPPVPTRTEDGRRRRRMSRRASRSSASGGL